MARTLDPLTPVEPNPQPGPAPTPPTEPGAIPTNPAATGGQVLPTGPAGPTGLFGQPMNMLGPGGWAGTHGKARWSMLQMTKPAMFAGPQAYQAWLASLPNDPSDPEYQSLVDAERHRFDSWSKSVSPDGKVPNMRDVVAKWQAYVEGQTGAGPSPTALHEPKEGLGPDTAVNKAQENSEKQIEKRDLTQARGSAALPVFKGRPINTDELYQSASAQDPFLQQFLTDQGVKLVGDDQQKALRSGRYVLMGQEKDAATGVSHDVFMFDDDAKAAAVRVDPNKFAKYQAGLGLIVTGKLDPTLENYWDQAVEMAQRSSMAGMRMSVQEWFDLLMTSAIAKKQGGGGGGSQPLEATDFYRAMMGVLGDISGVQG